MSIEVTDELLYKYVPLSDIELLSEISDDLRPDFEPSQIFYKKMKKLIRQSRHPKMHYRFMSAGGRVAAILVTVFVIGAALGVTAKAVKPFRMWVMKRFFPTYVEEHYSISGEGAGVLKQFTYVPEGYELVHEQKTRETYIGQFEDSQKNQIVFTEEFLKDGTTVGRDSEFTESHEVMIKNIEVLVGKKEDGWICCFWTEQDVFCTLLAEDLPEYKLRKMIENMQEF